MTYSTQSIQCRGTQTPGLFPNIITECLSTMLPVPPALVAEYVHLLQLSLSTLPGIDFNDSPHPLHHFLPPRWEENDG